MRSTPRPAHRSTAARSTAARSTAARSTPGRSTGRRPAPLALSLLAGAALAGSLLACTAVTADSSKAAAEPAVATSTPEITLSPRSAPRGDDIAHPYLQGRTVHVGDQRIAVPGKPLYLLGAGGGGYLVRTVVGDQQRVVRVSAARPPTAVGGSDLGDREPFLSADGSRLSTVTQASITRSTVRVYATDTARLLGHHEFPGFARPLDATGSRQLLSGDAPLGTVEWDVTTDRVRRLSADDGYLASYAADRLAVNRPSGDTTCSVVSSLTAPDTTLSRSCQWLATSFSPDGRLVLQADLDATDDAPSSHRISRVDGSPVVLYRTPASTLSLSVLRWLDDGGVLMDVASQHERASVACDLADCERVSPLRRIPAF